MIEGGCFCKRIRYTRDAPQRLESSADGTRYFCIGCGTHIAA